MDNKYPKVGLEGGPRLVELAGPRRGELVELAGPRRGELVVVVVVVVASDVSLVATSMVTDGMI